MVDGGEPPEREKMSDYKKCCLPRTPGYTCRLPLGHASACIPIADHSAGCGCIACKSPHQPIKQATCDLKQPDGYRCSREQGHGGPCACEAITASPAIERQVGGSHYKDMAIQPVQYIHANGIGFFEGNAIAYLTRWKVKGGISDLKKAIHHIELLIELEQKKGGVDAIQANL